MLTREQMAIINSTGDIKINAVAGSGKTTTLIEYAKVRPGYIVRPEGYKAPGVVGILGLSGLAGRHTEYVLATHINAFVSWFCNSDKAKVQELSYEEVVTGPGAREFVIRFKAEIAHQTRVFLDKMNRGEIPITHDFYLKKFQLSKPALPFDVILFDEVTLADDFITEKKIRDMVGEGDEVDVAKLSGEINLLYVAVTRAKSSLHVPGNIFPELVEKRGGSVRVDKPAKAKMNEGSYRLSRFWAKSQSRRPGV